MAEKAAKKDMISLPVEFSVTERGVRHENNGDPHCMVFPSLVRALGTFLGLEKRAVNDYNYAFQMGISTEGFALYYDEHFNKTGANKWGEQVIQNSLSVGGVKCRLAGINENIVCDELINFDTVKHDVCARLYKDYPVLIKQADSDTYLFVTGYKENGNILTAYKFLGGGNENHALNLKDNSEDLANWTNEIEAIIYIDGFGEPCNSKRLEIIKGTLQIACEMLTDTKLGDTGNYDYGEQLYRLWISRLDNDANYQDPKKDRVKYAYPEIPDYHERRLYAAGFFEQCHNLLGIGTLIKAGEAFEVIHYKCEEIYGFLSSKSEIKMPSREARNKIIALLKECQEQDHIAAAHIRDTLEVLK
jgi:hypothetical protein